MQCCILCSLTLIKIERLLIYVDLWTFSWAWVAPSFLSFLLPAIIIASTQNQTKHYGKWGSIKLTCVLNRFLCFNIFWEAYAHLKRKKLRIDVGWNVSIPLCKHAFLKKGFYISIHRLVHCKCILTWQISFFSESRKRHVKILICCLALIIFDLIRNSE